MQWLIVNKDKWLINDDSPACDEICEQILKQYPIDAYVDFKDVNYAELA